MKVGQYILHNVDRANCAAMGGEPSDYDHCIVSDPEQMVPNPLDGKLQAKWVFSGHKVDCYAWINDREPS